MPSSHGSRGSNKEQIPTYQDAIEPVEFYPVTVNVKPKTDGGRSGPNSPASSEDSPQHGQPELTGAPVGEEGPEQRFGQEKRNPFTFFVGRGKGWFQYMKTKEFWIVLLLG